MVHVGDNCHVAYVIASLHGIPVPPPGGRDLLLDVARVRGTNTFAEF
jgi:hypothetical protein